MKLCTFRVGQEDRVGLILDGEKVADLTLAYSALLHDKGKRRAEELAQAIMPPDMVRFLEGGEDSIQEAREVLRFLSSKPEPISPSGRRVVYSLSEVKLRAPVPRPPKLFCGVLNLKTVWDRLRTWEGNRVPDHPFYFYKATSAVIGPLDAIEVPDVLTWPEVELLMVINREAREISPDELEDYIVGYSILNDITAGGLHGADTVRYRNPDGTEGMPFRMFTRYKGYDTFAPMGPWIVTKDEVPDPDNLHMRTWLDDLLVQDGSTNELSYTCGEVVSFISSVHTLWPGDCISSGSCKASEGRMLRDNDMRRLGKVCRVEIERIGVLTNEIRRSAKVRARDEAQAL